MKTYLVLYVPVIHRGYLNLFAKYSGIVDGLFILGENLIEDCKFLVQEIEAIDPSTACGFARTIGYFKYVGVLESADVLKNCKIITTTDGMMRRFADKYLKENEIVWDSTFLRWDETRVISRTNVKYDRISDDPRDTGFMDYAIKEGEKSPDHWRQVGAVAMEENFSHILSGYNKDPINEFRHAAFGNVRDYVEAGTRSELTPTIHAEQVIIANASKRKFRLKNAWLYVSVFPCPTCAGLIAESGISKCFFAGGNAYFGVENILRANGVEMIFVKA